MLNDQSGTETIPMSRITVNLTPCEWETVVDALNFAGLDIDPWPNRDTPPRNYFHRLREKLLAMDPRSGQLDQTRREHREPPTVPQQRFYLNTSDPTYN